MTSLKNSYGRYKSEELNRVGLKQPFIEIGHNFFINQMVGLPLTKMTTFTHFIDCKRCFSTFSDFSQPWFVSEKYLILCSQCTASFSISLIQTVASLWCNLPSMHQQVGRRLPSYHRELWCYIYHQTQIERER